MIPTIDPELGLQIKTIIHKNPSVFDIRDVNGVVYFAFSFKEHFDKYAISNNTDNNYENDGFDLIIKTSIIDLIKQLGFSYCGKDKFCSYIYSVAQIPDLIELFQSFGFIYRQDYVDLCSKAYPDDPPPISQQKQTTNQGCCGNSLCSSNNKQNTQTSGHTIQQVAQSMLIQLDDNICTNDGSIRFLKDDFFVDLEESEKDNEKIIDSFTGEYEFLSNGYCVEQQSSIYYEDIDQDTEQTIIETIIKTFPSLEHAYQASKTLSVTDQEEIRTALTVGQAKRLGKATAQTSNFEANKLTIMERLVEDKFACNLRLKVRLLMTGTAKLVQKGGLGPKYQFWGVDDIGVGENHMGKILMKVRDRIIREEGDWKALVKTYLEKEGLGFVIEKLSCGQN